MRRWFLSYNSQDFELAQALEAELARTDPGGSIFFAPKSLRPGAYWMPALANDIAEATAFVLMVGEKGLGPWQATEYYEAYGRRVKEPGFPLILLLLDRAGVSAPGLPFLRQLHWIVTAEPASATSVAQLMDAAAGGGAPAGELWRHTAPYRGLAAMTESDADFFFGRGRETAEVIGALAAAPDRFPVLLGNSGVGKSSLAQAGVLAALMRQDWINPAEDSTAWPQVFHDSRRWCLLRLKPGTEPIRALVEPFIRLWQFDPTDPRFATRQAEWINGLVEGGNTLRDLLKATEGRLEELGQPKPPVFFIYVDQGEELYVRAEERQRRRFSQLVAESLGDPRLRAMMSLRADFFGELQKDEPLYAAHRLVSIPPLREGELRAVVSRPAALLGARFETETLADYIAGRTAEESVTDAGALPLLSYLLDDMWTQMVRRGDGMLRLPAQAIELGRVLVERADAFLARHPRSEDELRRVLTLKLATVREGEEPTRRRALRSEFTEAQWRLVSELADHPNRLLVTAAPEGGETYAEVAHEAIFRRWDRLRDWIAAEREFLAWKTGLEAVCRGWKAAPDASKHDALLMGAPLTQAQSWLGRRAEDLSAADRDFIAASMEREARTRRRARRVQLLVYGLLVGVIAGLVGWMNEQSLKEYAYMLAQVRPHVLDAAAERALKPGDSFKECAEDCPEMVVIPAGEFTMGSPASEQGRGDDEEPQHRVVFAKPLAVARFAVMFGDWDACVAYGDCDPRASDGGYGRGRQPVINVTWDDARQYAAWLSRMTGKPYRLLSEAEFEYAARAGTLTAYPWGDEIGKNNANCAGCGSKWDNRQPAPVGSFALNRFGLYDMHGNVFQWVEDCYHDSYKGAPSDGSAWTGVDCTHRVARGGQWDGSPRDLRSASRYNLTPDDRDSVLGFRIARTLTP